MSSDEQKNYWPSVDSRHLLRDGWQDYISLGVVIGSLWAMGLGRILSLPELLRL
jgi:hypothetical protein